MSDTPTKTQSGVFKILTRMGKVFLGLFFLLVFIVCGIFLWLRTDSAGSFIISQLAGALKGQGLYLTVDEISGPLPNHVNIKGVEFADDKGVWLRVDELKAEANALDLLAGIIKVNDIVINGAEFIRSPELAETVDSEDPEDNTEGFDLVLPVGIQLGQLTLKGGSIPWAFLELSPFEEQSLPGRAFKQRPDIEIKGFGSFENGKIKVEATVSIRAGDVLGIELFLDPGEFNKPNINTLGVLVKAEGSLYWDGLSDKISINTDISQEGNVWAFKNISFEGLGLSLKSEAQLNQATNHIEAKLDLRGKANGNWQNLFAKLSGLEESFIASVGNPLAIQLRLANTSNETFNFELDKLTAGVISGQGQASALFPENTGLPSSAPGSVNGNISIQISELSFLHPKFGGPLSGKMKASGDFDLAKISLTVASPKLIAPGGEINDFSLALTAAIKDMLEDKLSGSGELKSSSSSIPGVISDVITLQGDWQFAMNRTPGQENGYARFNDLDVQIFGLDVQGEIKAGLGKAFFAEKSSSNVIWPAGLALDGRLSLKVDNWQPLTELVGIKIDGTELNAQVQLINTEGVQNAKLALQAKSFNLLDVKISGLTTNAEAKFSGVTPDLHLDLQTAKSEAGPFNWASLAVRIDGNAGEGQFTLNMLKPQIPNPELSETEKAEIDSDPKLISFEGTYDLSKQAVELNSLYAKYPGTPLAVTMQSPASFSYKNGINLHNLDLNITPKGKLNAQAVIKPGTLNIRAQLTGIPLTVINNLAEINLPPGQLDADIDVKSLTQGSVTAELKLDKKLIPPSTASVSTIQSPVDKNLSPTDLTANLNKADVILQANLGGTSGRLALKGDIDFQKLLNQPQATQGSALNVFNSEPPITFSIPLLLDPEGIPMPDMNGPFKADVVWLGEIAPLWQMLRMPDRDLSGLALLNLHMGGSLKSPTFDGKVYVTAGQFEDRELGVILYDIKLEAQAASHKKFHLVLTASDGAKGKVGIEGNINPSLESAFNLRGRVEHLAPIHRDDLDLTLTALFGITGPLSRPNVNVQAVIERGEIVLLDSLMTGSVSTLDISNPDDERTERAKGLNLDISVKIPNRLYIRGRGLNSEWQGDLNITGTSFSPELKGNLKPVRGQFNLLSRTFEIGQGEIEFVGGTQINPGLNLFLTYTSPDIEATIQIDGSLKTPSFSLVSSPPLPQDEVLAQVLFGKDVSSLSRFEALQLASGLRTLTDGSGGFNLLTEMRETTGLDVLQFGSSSSSQDEPQASGQSGSSNLLPPGSEKLSHEQEETTIEAGKYLNNSIYVGIEKGVSQENTAIRVEIELFPNVSLQGRITPQSSQVGIGLKKDY